MTDELHAEAIDRERVTAPDAAPPAGPYSHGIRSGNLLFVAGQGPFDANGELVGDTFADQARAAFANVDAIARAAGSELRNAARIGVYLRSLSDFATLNVVMMELFTEPYPVRTTIPVDLPGFDIEVDAIIAIPGQ